MLRGILTRVMGSRGTTTGTRRPMGRTTGGSAGGAERGAKTLLKGMSRRRRGI